jgi:hypothetical protein
VGLFGFLLWGWLQRRTLKLTMWQVQAWVILLTTALLTFGALIYLGSNMSGAGQPRYLMPIMGVIGLVLGVGWANWFPPFRFLLYPILLLLMPFYALATLIWFIQPLYAPAPRLASLPPTAVSSPLPLAPDLLLVGYALEPVVAPLDGTVELQLFWQKTAPSETDWLLHFWLYDQFGAVVSKQQVWPEPNSSTAAWPFSPHDQNPIIMTTHPLTIPPYVAAGTAQLYLALAPGRDALPQTEPQPAGLLRLAEPSLVSRLPASARLTPYQVGDSVRLVGYTAMAANDQLQLDLYWSTSQPLPTDYTVFVQLFHNGELIAQQDNQPNQNRYPTSAWQPDSLIKDSYTLPLPPEQGQGTQYEIITGMYEWPSLTRLPISEVGEPRGDYIHLLFQRGR